MHISSMMKGSFRFWQLVPYPEGLALAAQDGAMADMALATAGQDGVMAGQDGAMDVLDGAMVLDAPAFGINKNRRNMQSRCLHVSFFSHTS